MAHSIYLKSARSNTSEKSGDRLEQAILIQISSDQSERMEGCGH